MKDRIAETYTASERSIKRAELGTLAEHFYAKAARIGVHAFVEFTGLMTEWLKLVDELERQGGDWTQTNTHTGQVLPMKEHHGQYLGEKLGCIFGPSLRAHPEAAGALLRELFGPMSPIEGIAFIRGVAAGMLGIELAQVFGDGALLPHEGRFVASPLPPGSPELHFDSKDFLDPGTVVELRARAVAPFEGGAFHISADVGNRFELMAIRVAHRSQLDAVEHPVPCHLLHGLPLAMDVAAAGETIGLTVKNASAAPARFEARLRGTGR